MSEIKSALFFIKKIKLLDLDPITRAEINCFVKENKSFSNTIFMTPAWARRIYSIYGIESEWTIYLKNSEIIGCHLIFDEYSGSLLFLRTPRFIKISIHSLLKILFSYNIWKVPLLLLKNMSIEDENKIISDLNKRITNLKNVKISPIVNRHREEINGLKIPWATYIFDFKGKDYKDISSRYSRSLKRSLKDSFLNFDLEVQVLDFSNDVDVDNFCNWVISAQKLTGKSFIYDKKTLNLSNSIFQEDGYIYRIFILFDKGRGIILGSLTIYGDANCVTEAEANSSIEARIDGLHVHDILRDGVVRFCIENGIGQYDLAGFNPGENLTEKEVGIKFSKQKFNAPEKKYLNLNW
jgi:hypothetical protein